MAKNTTAKIKQLKSRAENIDNEDLKTLQDTIGGITRIQNQIGLMESQKFAALQNIDKLNSQVISMQKTFVKKYGTDNVNIQTGAISYDDESSN